MFDKIVVAIYGSEFSRATLTADDGLAVTAGSAVEVVHVHDHDPVPSKAGMSPDLETPAEAQAVIAAAIEQLKESGVVAHGHLLQAHIRDVPRKIIDFAGESGADLIVVGRRGLPFSGVVGAIDPITPVARILGFSPLPTVFLLIVAAKIVTYLGQVECATVGFHAAHPPVFVEPPTTQRAQMQLRIARRISHFTRHGLAR